MSLYTFTAFRIHKKNIAALLRQCGMPNDEALELPLSAADMERLALREYDIRTFGLSRDAQLRALWAERELRERALWAERELRERAQESPGLICL